MIKEVKPLFLGQINYPTAEELELCGNPSAKQPSSMGYAPGEEPQAREVSDKESRRFIREISLIAS